jgi:hypothetical protein
MLLLLLNTTEYTQSRNAHFLAYIPSRWKNLPSLVGGGGGARPLPFTISAIMDKFVVYAPAERGNTLPLFLLYPYIPI